MDAKNGALIFRPGEAAAITSVFTGDADCHASEITIGTEAAEADPQQAQHIVRALHGVITDGRLQESQREEATNQLMHIALTGLRSSVDAQEQFARYKHTVSLTSAL
jgi:hypothetical protein